MSVFKGLAISIVVGGMSLASASSLNLFQNVAAGDLGSTSATLTFTDDYGTGSVKAKALGAPLGDLFYKTSGGDETGLGLANDSEQEISGTSYIQLDFTALLAQYIPAHPYALVSAVLGIGSAQTGEGYVIYGSTTAGTEGTTVLGSGVGVDGSVTLTLAQLQTYHYISVASNGSGNILLDSAALTSVKTPEPATSALMGGALLGISYLIRRRRKSTKV
jgi:PEP-CTERM motif